MAPADTPQIAIAVIVENAGWGAAAAAPIARRAFDYLLLGQYPSAEDMAAVQKGAAGAPIGKPRLAADMMGALVTGAGETSGGALAPPSGTHAAVAVAHPASAPKAADTKAAKAAGAVRATKASKKTRGETRTDKPGASAAPVATLLANPD